MTAPAMLEDPAPVRHRERSLTLCAFRTLALTPAEAEAALTSWTTQLLVAATHERHDGFALALPGARLELRPLPLAGGASKGHRLAFTGRLRSPRGWTSVPIQIELEPWSAHEAELNVRPLGPLCLRSASARKFFERHAGEALDLLAGLVTTPQPVRMPVADITLSLPGVVRPAPDLTRPAGVALAG